MSTHGDDLIKRINTGDAPLLETIPVPILPEPDGYRTPEPMIGAVRIIGKARQGFLTGFELLVEYYAGNGEWKRLRGVCSADVRFRADEMVTAHLEIELREFEATAMAVGRMRLAKHTSWWQTLWARARGWV